MYALTKTKITLESAQTLIAAHFGGQARIAHFTELTDGMYNAAFLIELTSGEKTVLKVAPPDDVKVLRYEKNIMLAEVEVLRLLAAQTRVPVPQIFAYDTSRSLIDNDYFIMAYISGTSLFKLRPQLSAADQYAIDLTLDLPPVTPAALQEMLRISPVIRALFATHDSLETATATAQAAGRYVVVETAPGATVQPGIPNRVLAPWRAGAVRPCAAGCEFVWTFSEDETPHPGLKSSGAAGFEIDQSDLEAWSGFGYKISQSAPAPAKKAPARKKTTVKKQAATTKKR